MIKLIKGGEEFNNVLPPKDYEQCYKLVEDDKTIGAGTINKDKENLMYIFVKQELRGNGYGKILFSKMLDEAKKIGYKEIPLTFPKENIQMVKIVNDNGGLHISTDEDEVKYVIPLK